VYRGKNRKVRITSISKDKGENVVQELKKKFVNHFEEVRKCVYGVRVRLERKYQNGGKLKKGLGRSYLGGGGRMFQKSDVKGPT